MALGSLTLHKDKGWTGWFLMNSFPFLFFMIAWWRETVCFPGGHLPALCYNSSTNTHTPGRNALPSCSIWNTDYFSFLSYQRKGNVLLAEQVWWLENMPILGRVLDKGIWRCLAARQLPGPQLLNPPLHYYFTVLQMNWEVTGCRCFSP